MVYCYFGKRDMRRVYNDGIQPINLESETPFWTSYLPNSAMPAHIYWCLFILLHFFSIFRLANKQYIDTTVALLNKPVVIPVAVAKVNDLWLFRQELRGRTIIIPPTKEIEVNLKWLIAMMTNNDRDRVRWTAFN